MYQLMFGDHYGQRSLFGAIAERMKYSTVLIFIGFWMFLVYFPMGPTWSGGILPGFMDGIWNPTSSIKAS